MIKKPSVFRYSWIAKLFGQVPSSYQSITLDLTEAEIISSASTETISYLDITDILIVKRGWWYQVALALSHEKKVHLGGFSKRNAKVLAETFLKYKGQYAKASAEIRSKTGEIVAFSEVIQSIQKGRSWLSKRDLDKELDQLKELDPVMKLPQKYFADFPDLHALHAIIQQFIENPELVRETANRKFKYRYSTL